MGLTVGSLAETLLPIALNDAHGIAGATPGGDFAALLCGLLGEENSTGNTDLLAALAQLGEDGGADGAGNDDLAASLAGSNLALAQLSTAVPLSGPIPTEADAPTTGIGTQTPQLEPVAPSASQGTPPTEADAPGAVGAAAGEQTPPAEQPATDTPPVPADDLLPPGNWMGFTRWSELPPWLRDIPDAEARQKMADSLKELDAAAGSDTTGVDPAAMANIEPQDSVVRFVGNAAQNEGQASRERDGRRGEPNASIQGIGHAADRSAVADLGTPEAIPPEVAAPAADQAVELPQAVRQVEQAVIDRMERGGGEAHIRLDPPELGAVHIRVRIEGEAVHVTVEADRQAAANLLRDHTQDLSRLLGDRGLNLTDVNVGQGGGFAQDPRDDRAWRQNGRSGSSGEFAALMGIDRAPASAAHNRLRSAYNPNGAHSYLV